MRTRAEEEEEETYTHSWGAHTQSQLWLICCHDDLCLPTSVGSNDFLQHLGAPAGNRHFTKVPGDGRAPHPPHPHHHIVI